MIAVSPSVVRTLDPAELDRVLIHEWVHVQRRDDLVNVLRTAVRILAGWHPGIWWIDRRLHVEREIACDERTVAITGSPKSYAACLMKLASLRDVARALQAAPAVVTMSGLRARITRIVTPPRSIAPLWARSLAVAIVSTLCAMSVGVSGLKLVEAVALAQPFTSTRMPGIIADALAPPAAPAPSSTASRKPSSRRSTTSSPRAQRPPATEPQPSSAPPPPSSEPAAPLPSSPVPAVEPAPSTSDARGDHTATETAAVVHTPDSRPPDATPEPPRSPWAAVADGGAAIGRKSKDAGVATAGFFTRVARRVAGSF
jgi:hypothetical protein